MGLDMNVMKDNRVTVVGAGLAGVEASLQLAKRGIKVMLYDMKPEKKSPAHVMDSFAELVCSNSFRSNQLDNAVGLLKAELRVLGSEVMEVADRFRVPAGNALAVDREAFSLYLTQLVEQHPYISVIHEEVMQIPECMAIIATGPLTSEAMARQLMALTGENSLYFFDAIAPIITFDSIDMDIAYKKNRYDKGDGLYINCPMNQAEYASFYQALIHARSVEVKDFEMKVFEGCMPIEEMARRGEQTLLFGPLKPIGLDQPSKKRPYAVVQLRQDNLKGNLYNMVGFQTHLAFPEQKRIIQMIPGLQNAEIVRYGVMHRNIYVNAPNLLSSTYEIRKRPGLYIAGQLSGVEGYVESIASGLVSGISAARACLQRPVYPFPLTSIIGAQADYIAHAEPKDFQPMNANFGLLPPIEGIKNKKEKKMKMAERSLDVLREWMEVGHYE
jgi:methylenetetrahydrofolate--tRNA-(uracil-5-)-methyltransferase